MKPAIALTIASPAESYIEAIPDNYSKNNEEIKLYKTAKKVGQKVGQTVVGIASATSAAADIINGGAEIMSGLADADAVKKVGQTVVGIASATSAAAGLSGGAGIMSGLAGAGAVVGGGAIAGIGVLGAGPTAVTTMVMDQVCKDDEKFTGDERQARAVCRKMTTVGAVAGTAGAVSAIGAVGSVAGLSAAGITSGLATIGATVGGGMAAGVVVTVAAPAVTAAAVGYGAYQIWKRLKETPVAH